MSVSGEAKNVVRVTGQVRNAYYDTDQHFDGNSLKPQSGVAVKQAIDNAVAVLDDRISLNNLDSRNSFGNALKNKVSGKAIHLTDVSPIQHEMTVKVIEGNPSAVKVGQYGKNMLSIDAMLNDALVKNADGSYKITKNGSVRLSRAVPLYIPANTKFSMSLANLESNSSVQKTLILMFARTSGSYLYKRFEVGGSKTLVNNSTPYDITSVQIYIDNTESDGTYYTFRDLMIELGETATKYEPCLVAKSITPNAAGEVIGVESTGEVNVLTVSSSDATIECEYNRDINAVILDIMSEINALK